MQTSLILLVSLFGLQVAGKQLAAQPTDIDAIRESCKMTAKQISQVEYSSETHFSSGGRIATKYSRDGLKYYWESRVLNAGTGPAHFAEVGSVETVAYDLERYQTLSHSTGLLRITQDPRPGVGVEPLLVPYWWLLAGNGSKLPTWESIRNDNVWDSAFNQAVHLSREVTDGYLCDLVRIPCNTNGQDSQFDIWLAVDLGHFPVRYTRRGAGGTQNDLLSEYNCMKLSKYSHDGRDGAIAISLKYNETGNDKRSLKCSFISTLDQKSIRINEPISPELFTISPNRVAQAIDIHASALAFNRGVGPVRSLSPRMRWLIAILMSLIAAIGAFLAMRHRYTGSSHA